MPELIRRSFVNVLFLGGVVALFTGCSARPVDWANQGAPPGTGFLSKQIEHEGTQRNYTVFIPHSYASQKHVPVIVFLHGVLEGGTDGKKNVAVGIGPAVSTREDKFQFIVIFPQSTSDWQGESDVKLAMATLDAVLKDYPAADPDQVFLTGLSNGGDGTWSIGARYPERFAGLVPMCSGPNYDDVPKLSHSHVWAFHNSVDPFRSSGKVHEMCNRLQKAGGDAKYTEYGELGHDCWTRAYSDDAIFTWMASLHRGTTARASVPTNLSTSK